MNEVDLAERLFGVSDPRQQEQLMNALEKSGGDTIVNNEGGSDNEVKQSISKSQGWSDMRQDNDNISKLSGLVSLVSTIAEAI